ncbi:hypothetical protein ACFY6U_28250 [Streptomyces sp. NPDC013157]
MSSTPAGFRPVDWLTEPELRSALLEWRFTPDSHEAFSRYLAFRTAQS